jgi:hypothetical protein
MFSAVDNGDRVLKLLQEPATDLPPALPAARHDPKQPRPARDVEDQENDPRIAPGVDFKVYLHKLCCSVLRDAARPN